MRADRRRPLPDAAREHERVQPAERRRHRGDRRRAAGGRRRRAPAAAPRSPVAAPARISRMSARPAEAQQARAVLQRVGDLRGRSAALRASHSTIPGSMRPGARRHDEALERREAHRRVDRPAAVHGRQRRPRAEVAGDDPERRVAIAPAQHGGAPRRVCVRQPVEPVAPDRPRSPPRAPGSRTSTRPRERRVERGVEARDVRDVRAAPPETASIPASDFGWWSGASAVSASIAGDAASSSATGADEPRPAVDHPVPDGLGAPPTRRSRPRRAARPPPAHRRQVRRLEDAVVDGSSTRSLRLLDPALTTRITPSGAGHAQFAISGASSPSSRVYARASIRLSTMQLPDVPGPRREARAPGRSRRSRGGTGRGR